MAEKYIPKAVFDSVEFLNLDTVPEHVITIFSGDYKQAKQFLLSYKNNPETFKRFRQEIERYIQYCWFVASKNVCNMRRDDVEQYLLFCKKPPVSWVATKKYPRFLDEDSIRKPNPNWRPFLVTVSKAEFRQGKKPRRSQYRLSEKSFREIFSALNRFYSFLIQEDITEINPVAHIKQRSRFFRSYQTTSKIRRISEQQWQQVIKTAEELAASNPEKHQRTLFIMSALYSMYLRISELVAHDRWVPTMNSFHKDHENRWWFTVVGKGNKERSIAVSESMLEALKNWRKYLNITPTLPLPNDNAPLIPKLRGKGPITVERQIRRIVQTCFDEAINKLNKKGLQNEAEELMQATVHWLRHTGISEDVKNRPREHVRDDAGHSSSSITDKYIDINLRERHQSAKHKNIKKTDKPKK